MVIIRGVNQVCSIERVFKHINTEDAKQFIAQLHGLKMVIDFTFNDDVQNHKEYSEKLLKAFESLVQEQDNNTH